MHQPYLNAVGSLLKESEIVFDKFHVLQHASAALDEVRRQEFFRAGALMRAYGRGKRWLLLRRWKTVRGKSARSFNSSSPPIGRLFKAYVLREQLDRLWTYKYTRRCGAVSLRLAESPALATPVRDGEALICEARSLIR
jgi:transposase